MKDHTPIHIMVVADHHKVREALTLAFDTYDGFECVGAAIDGSDALRLMSVVQPDVMVITGLILKQEDIFTAIKAMRRLNPNIAIIILNHDQSSQLIRNAMDAGVTACLTEHITIDEVANRIVSACEPPYRAL
jgi:DNA-binding NarL/FixJ family response regulator